MKWHGVSVYNNGDFQFTKPYIYTNNAWKTGTYYVYTNGAWETVGGACTQLIPFLASDGSPVYVNGDQFLVRQMFSHASLKESAGKYLKDADGKVLYSEYRG